MDVEKAWRESGKVVVVLYQTSMDEDLQIHYFADMQLAQHWCYLLSDWKAKGLFSFIIGPVTKTVVCTPRKKAQLLKESAEKRARLSDGRDKEG